MANEIVLDVHLLQPPAPMELALDALEKLQSGDYIKMIHRMQPFPLYKILSENNFKYRVAPGKISAFDIYIWKSGDKEAVAAVDTATG